MKTSILPFLVSVLFIHGKIFSQTTFDRVYSILQTRCTGNCHSYGNPTGSLRFDDTKQNVLNNLINVTPDNDAAESRGLKRVWPGDARKSFLFQKVNRGLDANISLRNDEGAPMPKDTLALSEVEREMIRQWIIFGAADTGYHYVDEQLITDYYNGFAEARDPSLPVPDPSEGYQIYYGPIFLAPGREIEFDAKFPLYNTEDVEVYRMNVAMNKESHHMAVFKYKPGMDALVPPGLKRVNNLGDAAALFFSAEVVAQWPNSLEVELPQGTALMWDSNSVLNISYHILNYSDSIIAAEVYYNIYTRPRQPGTIPMVSYPVRYDGHPVYQGGWDVQNLILYPSPNDTTLRITQYSPDSTFYWNLWSIQAHTHKFGKDYNVWLRNPDGTKGEIIYDGSYDVTHSFDQGFYDWEHPPLRYFDPPQSVDMTAGMIHEAVYNNNTGDTIGFGLKTTDEMFVSYIFFTKSQTPLGILPNKVFNDVHVKIYPNPAQQQAKIHIGPDVVLKNACFRVFDLLGKEVLTVNDLSERQFVLNTQHLPGGNYFYRLVNDGQQVASGKLTVQR
ncbi:MAG TPA: T9SS type A sorting domain-containing protein [Chitinophagales bacterium]|nr:T9SS type A sorting domain-containing protein [Chitinophagales bacterium]